MSGASKQEERDGKGRCRLDFAEKKPLEGMRIFLDIPNHKVAEISALIVKLGGVSNENISWRTLTGVHYLRMLMETAGDTTYVFFGSSVFERKCGTNR